MQSTSYFVQELPTGARTPESLGGPASGGGGGTALNIERGIWSTMPNEFRGSLNASDTRFAVVVSRYNESITSKLLEGAIGTLQSAGVSEEMIDVAWVPGAWEIPLVAKLFADTDAAAVLCLGAVIRGETTHDQYINQQLSASLGRIALEAAKPVLFGVLTCNSLEQAIQRSGGQVGNKGIECAQAALEMVTLLQTLPDRR